MMERFEVRDFLKNVEKLPTLPGIAMRIIEMANNPKSAADDLSRIIVSDQSLSAKVLRLVNSAYYGIRNRVSSVKQATVILGFNTIKSLALSTAIMDKFATTGVVEGFSRGEFWKHSLGVAITNRILARKTGMRKDEEETFFMAGLLHDIGKVILDQYFHEEFVRVLQHLNTYGGSFHSAEKEVNGLTHAEIGGLLASQWQLPEELIAAIRFHHAPQNRTEHVKYIAATHFADILVKTKGFGSGGDQDLSGLDESVVGTLGISEADVAVIVGVEMDREYQNASEFLRLMEIES
ncbi:MAG: HDOD domain-containing protein [Candidatus Hydrogenedentota bacterium]|nr:MAG: HDOD domain-containing protein [Candidatus Hydrogenedentota bacterium]